MIELFSILLAVHFLCDFPLQGDFVAVHKSRHVDPNWPIILLAHCFIHGLGVYIVLKALGHESNVAMVSMWFMVLSHFIIDFMKNDSRLTFFQDQMAHLIIVIIITLGVML